MPLQPYSMSFCVTIRLKIKLFRFPDEDKIVVKEYSRTEIHVLLKERGLTEYIPELVFDDIFMLSL